MKQEQRVFDLYGKYYDLLYGDKDYQNEVSYVISLLEKFGNGGNRLLEFGSGTGVHGGLLAQNGFEVLGVERSQSMIDRSTPSKGFKSILGDICDIHLNQSFDAVISLFHVLSYQISNLDVQSVFNRAFEHLNPRGLFIFDVWYTPAVYSQLPSARIKTMENDCLRVTRFAEPIMHNDRNVVDVNYDIFIEEFYPPQLSKISETHNMRHFSILELDYFAQVSGFKHVAVEEFLSGNQPSNDTWGVTFVFEKP